RPCGERGGFVRLRQAAHRRLQGARGDSFPRYVAEEPRRQSPAPGFERDAGGLLTAIRRAWRETIALARRHADGYFWLVGEPRRSSAGARTSRRAKLKMPENDS